MARIKRVASADKVRFAREQRRNPTRAEKALWQALRRRALGVKFRRQHPIGEFVLDFYCEEARLAVEIDGPVHAGQVGYDRWRDEQIGERKIRVLRVASGDVEADVRGVLERIKACLTPGPSPSPAEAGSGEGSNDERQRRAASPPAPLPRDLAAPSAQRRCASGEGGNGS